MPAFSRSAAAGLVVAALCAACGYDSDVRVDPAAPPAVRALKVLGCEAGLRVEFAGDLAPETVAGGFTVENASGTAAYDAAGRAVTYRPEPPFRAGESYTAVIGADLESIGGTRLGAAVAWQFVCVDRTPPVVVGRLPLGDGVSPLAQVSIRFSEPIDDASVTSENFRVEGVPAHPSYDAATRTVTLVPRRRLYPGRTYWASVSARVRDAAGNALGADVRWSFRTRAALDDWAARVVTPPLPASAPCDTPIELRLAPDFDLDVAALVAAPVAIEGVPELAVEWDAGRRVVRVLPLAPLRPGRTYDVVATGALRDRGGDRAFDEGERIVSVNVVPSCEEPTVAFVRDAFGTTACAGPVTARFSVPMDPVATAPAIELRSLAGGNYDPATAPAVEADVGFDAAGLEASVVPRAPLAPGYYWLAIGGEARGLDGRALREAGGWQLSARCE